MSSIVVAVLTVVLVVITIIYVHANLRMAKTIETDLRYRTKPLPEVALSCTVQPDGWFVWDVVVKTDNAPLRFQSLELKFHLKSGHVSKVYCSVANRVLRLQDHYKLNGKLYPDGPVEASYAVLKYTDLAELRMYTASFDASQPWLFWEEKADPPGR